MVKKTFILFILNLQIASLNAQNGPGTKVFSWDKVELGIKGGLNTSWRLQSRAIEGSYSLYNSISTGVAGLYHINPGFSIKIGLSYEGEGYIIATSYKRNLSPYESITEYYYDSTSLNYATLSILSKISFGKQSRFFAEGGAYLGYLLNAITKGPTYDSFGRAQILIIKNNYNTTVAGIVLGLGYDLPIGERLIAELEVKVNIDILNMKYDIYATNQYTSLLLELRYKL